MPLNADPSGSGALDYLENLRTIAEIATAFAGFTGVVIVLGHRAAGAWSEVERTTIRILLETSIGVVFFALLPTAFILNLSAPTTWRLAAGLLAAYHSAILFRADVLDRRQAGQLLGRRIDWGLSITGIFSILANALVASGFVPQAAAIIYTLALLHLLLVAALAFVALLLSGGRPAA